MLESWKTKFEGKSRSAIVNRNIFGSLLIKGFSVAISLLLVPMTLNYVGSELYGIWLTLSSFLFFIAFFDVGFSLGFRNRLAEAVASDDWSRGKELVSTTYVILTCIFVPIFILLELVAVHVDWVQILSIDAKYSTEVSRVMAMLIAVFCLQMVLMIINNVLSALQKTALASALVVIGNALSLIAIFFFTRFSVSSFYYLSLAMAIPPLIVFAVVSIFIFNSKQYSRLRPSLASFRRYLIGDILNLGVKFFILQIQILVITSSTNFLILKISSADDVTSYNVAYRYLGLVAMLFAIFVNPLWPAFTDAFVKRDYDWMRSTYRRMLHFLYIALAIELLLLVISPLCYRFWVGNAVDISWTMNVCVCLFVIFQMVSNLHITLINGIGAIGLQTVVAVLIIIMHIPVSYLFGTFVGGAGVVVSLSIIYLIQTIFSKIQLRKILDQTASGIWIK